MAEANIGGDNGVNVRRQSNRPMVKLLAAIVVSVCATACHTPSAVIEHESLRATQRKEQIVLTERIVTSDTRGANVRFEEGALPGVYIAEREDSDGVYFFGKERPIWSKVGTYVHVMKGGIFIPKERALPPQFFFLLEPSHTVVKSVDDYLLQKKASEQNVANSANDYLLQRTVQDTTSPTSTVSPGASIVANSLVGAVIQSMAAADYGKFSKLPAIKDADIKERLFQSVQAIP